MYNHYVSFENENIILEIGKDLSTHFSKEDTHVISVQMKTLNTTNVTDHWDMEITPQTSRGNTIKKTKSSMFYTPLGVWNGTVTVQSNMAFPSNSLK
jgi:hypothetical protein